MSLHSSRSNALNRVVKKLIKNGIHVVVAAGNDYYYGNACDFSSASEPSAITVGTTENTRDAVSLFSNVGKCLDIFLHLVQMFLMLFLMVINKSTFVFSGTSQATPHVTGTIALKISRFGNDTPDKVAKKLNRCKHKKMSFHLKL